jgi:hypothetical protein
VPSYLAVEFYRVDPVTAAARQVECGRIDLQELAVAHQDSIT